MSIRATIKSFLLSRMDVSGCLLFGGLNRFFEGHEFFAILKTFEGLALLPGFLTKLIK